MENDKIVAFYVKRVIDGYNTIEEVPEVLRELVEAELTKTEKN